MAGRALDRAAGDEKKAALLNGLPGAAERLTLFQADIYDAATFEPAIQGCDFVFLVATPLMHNPGSSKVRILDPKSKNQFSSVVVASSLASLVT
ncbi:hypothetical protein ACQ4PT_071425 [Festuca glaucescens]